MKRRLIPIHMLELARFPGLFDRVTLVITDNASRSHVADFRRGLSDDLMAALNRLTREPGGQWWKDVLANKDLLLAVRGGYLNAYARGQSIFKIGPKMVGGVPRVETHYKYLIEPEMEEGSPYVQFDGEKFLADPTTLVRTGYVPEVTLQRMIRTASRFSGAEKQGVHRIAAKEPKVVDLEIAFSEGDFGGKSTAPRMDLAVLIPGAPGSASLVFCEAKCADNVELWKLAENKDSEDAALIACVSQIRTYETFIGDAGNHDALVAAYVSACQTLVDLHEQGYRRNLDPLVEAVATKRMQLAIHPSVFLLVYGFDADQKKGAVRNGLAKLGARDMLGHRVIAKGDPRSFSLSNDIFRRENAPQK